jgi:hypothetical protein
MALQALPAVAAPPSNDTIGGATVVSISEALSPTVDITVDPIGLVDPRMGVVYLTGTYTCSNADFIDVFGDAQQTVGRSTIIGSFVFSDVGTCDGTVHTWSATVYPQNGKFVGGPVMTLVFGISCAAFIGCASDGGEQTGRLRGGNL